MMAIILFHLLSFSLFFPFSRGLTSKSGTSSLSRSSVRSFTRSGTTSRSRSATLTVTRSGSPTRCRSATTSLSLSSTTSISGSLSRRPSLTVTVSRSPTTTSCPPGYAGLSCKICGPGTYSSSTGSPFCLPCPAGVFGSTSGLTSAACSGNCTAAPGYFCPSGSTSPTPNNLCTTGTYCAGGSAVNATCYPMTACTVAGLSAQPVCYWNVSTLAGNGVAATLDGQGTLASLFNPYGVTNDDTVKNSNVYVSEWSGHRIRTISPSGTVTTLAGSGAAAFADGLGVAASLKMPTGMVVDAQGFIYLADVDNNRIRKVSPSGFVSTIAGSGTAGGFDGIGTNAQFSAPNGLAFTRDWAFIFITDGTGHKIRRMALFDFTVTTLAGSGIAGFADGIGVLAQFNFPASNVYHPAGVIFIADGFVGTRIRRVDIASALVTTLAGNGVAGGADGIGTFATFNMPRGIALNGLFSILYVVEDTGARIRSIDIQTAVVKTIAGTGIAGYADGFGVAAAFNRPITVTVSNEGYLYVADYQTSRVRKLTCVPCPASYYCASGAPVICPAAFYCPLSSINPTLAPPGTFSPSTGASSPTPCFPGTYNPLSGQTSCLQCEPGYFCPSSSTSMSPCGISNYCPRGSSSPTPCPIFMAVDAALGPANGPAYDVDTAACLTHCYSGGPGQTSSC